MAVVQRADQPRSSPGWLLDEVAKAGRENLDVAHVERYDRKMHEHSTFTWLLEAMFERTGFTLESADHSDDGFDARYLLCTTSHPSA